MGKAGAVVVRFLCLRRQLHHRAPLRWPAGGHPSRLPNFERVCDSVPEFMFVCSACGECLFSLPSCVRASVPPVS
jgi:hypothetical protein